jgi:5'-nucleotidase
MNEHLTVALDSDGVVADFSGFVSSLNGGMVCETIPRGKLWSSVAHYDKTVGPFFEALPKMPDADELMDFVVANFINRFVLTAAGYTPPNGAVQKKNWYAKHYGKDLVVKVVNGSGDKAAFATPTTILIDDREKSIIPWVAAGGIGILHRNANDTIERLKEIIDELRPN